MRVVKEEKTISEIVKVLLILQNYITGGARINDMRKKLERGSVCHFISDCPPPNPTPIRPGIPIPINGHSDSDEYLNI